MGGILDSIKAMMSPAAQSSTFSSSGLPEAMSVDQFGIPYGPQPPKTYFGDVMDKVYLGDKVAFYPPGYVEKGWAPDSFYVDLLKSLGRVLPNKKLNPVAREHALANALVEGRIDYGNNDGTPIDADYGIDMEAAIDKLTSHYLDFYNYKTGKYADHVYGQDASEADRLSLWNGAGRVKLGNKVVADAQNHASKVLNMQAALSRPENRKILELVFGASR